MNLKQAELMGIFSAIPTGSIDTYYLDKFKNTYATAGETIKLDEVITELTSLSVVPRGTKAKQVKVNGFVRETVTPDIISGKSSLTTNDLLQIQAGQVDTVVNGKIVNNYQIIKDRHLAKLKNGLINTQARMSAELYLTGKVSLPESADEIDFGFEKVKAISKQRANMDWTLFILELVNEYKKSNGIYPTTIEVDTTIFGEMLKDATFRDQIKAFNSGTLTSINNKFAQPVLNVLGYQIKALPNAVGLDGKDIDTANQIFVTNDSEFVKAFAGLSYAEDNQLKLFSGEYLITEVIEKDPASQQFILESGFVPIIPIPKRIKRYKLTLS